MNQPVALIAKIHLKEVAFKKVLRSPAIALLAESIAQDIRLELGNYTIFRYLKGNSTTDAGALFAFFYINHGNADTLIDSHEMKALRYLADFAAKSDSATHGTVLMTLDALNLGPADSTPLLSIANGICMENPPPSSIPWPSLLKDCEKYFYKETETPFALNFARARIIDKAIVKRCKTLLEKHRLQDLMNQMPNASWLRPLFLFGKFFFNGTHVYHQSNDTTLLHAIDARHYMPAPWGGVDERHVVVDSIVRAVDVASFKMLQFGEVRFFKDRHGVFDSQLRPMVGWDSASFKLRSEVHAEDANHVYFCGQTWNKAELGEPHVRPGPETYLDHYADYLLQGRHAVYMGRDKLDVDAPSFQLLRTVKHPPCHVVVDRRGQYLLYKLHGEYGEPASPHLLPAPDIDAALTTLSQIYTQQKEGKSARAIPKFRQGDGADLTGYVNAFANWAEQNFDAAYARAQYRPDDGLYGAINNYFYALFKLSRPADVLAFYPRIAPTAWLNPYLFHHTACCFVAQGQYEEALTEIYHAVVFGYEQVNKLWNDVDLLPLHADPRFQAMAKQAQSKTPPGAAPELLDAILQMPRPDTLAKRDANAIPRFLGALAASGRVLFDTPTLDDPRAAQMREVFKHYLNHRSVEGFLGKDAFYDAYQRHDWLHPLAHYIMFKAVLRSAHAFTGYVDPKAMDRSLALLRKFQSSVAQATDPEILAEIAQMRESDAFLSYALDLSSGS